MVEYKYQCKIVKFTTWWIKISNKKWNQNNPKIISNVIGYENDETKFPHKLLQTDRQVASLCLCKVFGNNNVSANMKLPKTQLSKVVQSA